MGAANADDITPVAVQPSATRPRPRDVPFQPFALEPPTAEQLREHPEQDLFAFTPEHLHRLVAARHHDALGLFSGIHGLAAGLRTDLRAGLSADEDDDHKDGSPGGLATRRHLFGENRVPRRRPKTFVQLLWLAFNDKLMFLLTGSAAVSLALGIYQTVHHTEAGPRIEWVEGVAILVAVVVIVLATALNDLQQNRKFQKLNEKKQERKVTVTRSGKTRIISIFHVVVGDILHVEAGDVVPADCIVLSSSEVQTDESSLTGESDLLDKVSAFRDHGDHLLLSGTRVIAGVGSALVVAVGTNSTYGRVIMSLDDHIRETPLQQKLGRLAKYIIKFGLGAGFVFFVIQFSRFLARLISIEGGSQEKGQQFLELFILSITIIIIVVPEGLPLLVTIALAFATTRMLKDNNLVRSLRSCETMGNATTVCSDKTGTLTQNKMSVSVGVLGKSLHFGRAMSATPDDDQVLPMSSLNNTLSPDVVELLRAAIAVNSTAMETDVPGEYIGSSTESSLLKFAKESLGMGEVSYDRDNASIVHMIPFDSRRKWMAVVIRHGQHFRLLVKGAAEVVLGKCDHVLTNPRQDLTAATLSPSDSSFLSTTVNLYAGSLLRVVVTAYKDLDTCEIDETGHLDDAAIASLVSELTFLAAFGIRDPLRPHVSQSVKACRDAGVFVRMVTGDNFLTARSVSSECGIYTPGGIAIDGPTFRRLTDDQLDQIIGRIQVLARSSPEDKKRLVSHLQGLGEIVAVTGDGTNDALALKCADIGFSMGISGTEVAKEASDIILLDDNFSSIVKAMSWGRGVNDATKKFLQFQFTINISAGILTVVGALISGSDESVFTVVQLLWVNLLMDTFASLALSTDYPTQSSLLRRPEPRTAPILNTTMWKMIAGQSIYQAAVMFTLHYAGPGLFNATTEEKQRQVQTMGFNVYVWMQFFNQQNCRRADNHLNIYEGVFRNPWFFFVQAVIVGGQLAIVFVGGEAFETSRLTPIMWAWSMLFGFLTLPLGVLIRYIPDQPLSDAWRFIIDTIAHTTRYRRKPGDHDEEVQWNDVSWRRRVARRVGIGKKDTGLTTTSTELSSADVHLTQPPDEVLEAFDLQAAIEAARLESPNSETHAGLTLHPETKKDDPILDTTDRSHKVPPSQDPQLRKYMDS